MYTCSIIILLAAASSALAQSAFWSPSRGPYGGTVNVTVVTSRGTLLAATSRGLFRSTDDGDQWSLTAPALRQESVEGLAATSSGAVIAASSQRYLRSTDDGVSWTHIPGELMPSYIVSGSSGHLLGIVAEFNPMLYRSTDDGISWTPTQHVAFDIHVLGSGLVFAYSFGWVASWDSGATWSAISQPLRILTAAARRRGDTIFIAGVDTGSARVIARSIDNGITWSDATSSLEGRIVDGLVADAEGRMLALLRDGVARWSDTERRWNDISPFSVEPVDPTYARLKPVVSPTTGSIHLPAFTGNARSSDHGATWTSSNEGMNAQSMTDIETLANGDIFAASLSDIFRSSDLGRSWTATGSMRWTTTLAVTPTGVVIAGGYYRLKRSTDHGATWSAIRERDSLYVHSVVATPNGHIGAIVSVRDTTYITTSTDDGETWQDVPLDPWTERQTLWAGPSGELFVATHRRVRRTSDRGATWRHVVDVDELVTAILPLADGDVMVGTREGRVFTLDNATGGIERSGPLDTADIVDLEVDREGRVYAITNSGKAFRRSADVGGTWQDISSGIEMTALARLHAHASGYLLLASRGGSVQRSASQVTRVKEDPETPLELDLSAIGE